MLLVSERRIAVLFYAIQGILAAILMLPGLYRPVAMVRMGTALVTAILLSTSAGRSQPWRAAPEPARQGGWFSKLTLALRATSSGDMGLGFRAVVVIFGTFVVYGLWRTYPFELAPRWIGFALYELMVTGLLMILTHVDPLRKGLGLLTLMNGFQNLYLYLEQSLLVITLWQFLLIITALAVAYFTEAWRRIWPRETDTP
ncbi:MAG: hypothetical protein JXA74_10265 [Anaerolineae bacterium]|nr:hypothetical protein [Anaerolineae bacterium]